jgi:hypothetical protein
MASYTILTNRKQEIGLKFSYDTYADKEQYPTQEAYLQFKVSSSVTDPMYFEQQRAMSRSFDESFNTIPETNQPIARTEIEATITNHGGTIVPPGQPVSPATTMSPIPPSLPQPLPTGSTEESTEDT